MTIKQTKISEKLQNKNIESKYEDWGELGFLYLFDVSKVILLLSGEASLPTLLSKIDGMPSTKTLRRWLEQGTEPRKSTLIKYMTSLIQFSKNELEMEHKYCDLFGVPHDFTSLSRQEQETIIESLNPNIQHPWDEIIMLLQVHGDRFESTCKLIQDLIDAEIKILEYMQERLPHTEEISLISDEVWGGTFLEAVSFSFEKDGFTTLFKFLYEPFGLNSPKKHNKTLLNVFHQNIDADHLQNILNILKHFRLSVFGILAGVF